MKFPQGVQKRLNLLINRYEPNFMRMEVGNREAFRSGNDKGGDIRGQTLNLTDLGLHRVLDAFHRVH